MSERNDQILKAAISVFSRYGVAKTTMNDIAAEAGVARQTVYNAFPGKTEILRAAVGQAMDEALDAIKAAWSDTDDLGERIDIYFAAGPIKWFDAVRATPELADLLEGVNTVACEELAAGKAQWVSYFAGEFEAAGLTSRSDETSIGSIVEFMYDASKAAKSDAADRDDLLARLTVVKLAVIALTERR